MAKLKCPLYVFTGLQFEPVKPVDGDVIVVVDCAKSVLERSRRVVLGQLGGISELHADLGQYPGAVELELHLQARRDLTGFLRGNRNAERGAIYIGS